MKRLLGPAAAVLCVLGIVVLVAATAVYARRVVPEGMFPVREFDANTPVEVDAQLVRYRFVLYAQVERSRDEPPETVVSLTAEDGRAIELVESSGWADLLGRHYVRLGRFEVATPQTVTITATSGPLEDFAVFHDFGDVVDHNRARLVPAWALGAVLLLGAAGATVGLLARSNAELEASR